MIRTLKSLAILSILLTNASSAFAEKYPDNDEVSTMKGELVKVGDRNNYHYSYPRINLSVNPFSLITGQYSISGSYAFTENVALRGDLNIAEKMEHQEFGYEVGVSSQIFFRKMYSGFYLEPGIVRKHEDRSDSNARYDVFGPQILGGYAWFWDSGFNIQLAGGVGRNLMKVEERDYSATDTDVRTSGNVADRFFGNGYLRVGYAF